MWAVVRGVLVVHLVCFVCADLYLGQRTWLLLHLPARILGGLPLEGLLLGGLRGGGGHSASLLRGIV